MQAIDPCSPSAPLLRCSVSIGRSAEAAPQDWFNIKYLDQFQYFATGKGMNVPVMYARAAKEIDWRQLRVLTIPITLP